MILDIEICGKIGEGDHLRGRHFKFLVTIIFLQSVCRIFFGEFWEIFWGALENILGCYEDVRNYFLTTKETKKKYENFKVESTIFSTCVQPELHERKKNVFILFPKLATHFPPSTPLKFSKSWTRIDL